MVNFATCMAVFEKNSSLIAKYGYTGPLRGVTRNYTSQITWRGCEELCGTGFDWYPWAQIADTITTWILPIIGVIAQAPFESNQFWATCFAIFRWCGNPVASLSYILWNIRVTGRCALLVDMAVPFDEIPKLGTNFSDMRDSLYILTSMNQFSLNPSIANALRRHTVDTPQSGQGNALPTPSADSPRPRPRRDTFETVREISGLKDEGEGLLRIALFSKDLRLEGASDRDSLRKRRQILARNLRENRRRGVVPVFVSILWFLVALAISIQSSFADLGLNAAAHDLGLGLLLAWLPVLVLSSIVDRNSISTDRVLGKLNKLVDLVCEALEDDEIREQYINTFQDRPDKAELEKQVNSIYNRLHILKKEDFFIRFAGQGRVRWHYGAAQPILTSIERHYIAERGRGWLADEDEARIRLVLGKRGDSGLIYFDYREFWQVLLSTVIITGPIAGAFIISYWTPTIGFGCRSGGYTIFWSLAVLLAILEMIIWITVTPFTWVGTLARQVRRASTFVGAHTPKTFWQRANYAVSQVLRFGTQVFEAADSAITAVRKWHVRWSWRPKAERKEGLEQLQSAFEDRAIARRNWGVKEWLDSVVFKPLEFINASWLAYIVFAQGTGFYQTCECMSSIWGFGGGYIDFTNYYVSMEPWLKITWSLGTGLACLVMAVAMVYIVIEWCTQSHLSTQNYEDACVGLRRTRQWRRAFRPVLRLFSFSTLWWLFWHGWASFFVPEEHPTTFHNKDTVVWTVDVTNRDVKRILAQQNRDDTSRTEYYTSEGDDEFDVDKVQSIDSRGVHYPYGSVKKRRGTKKSSMSRRFTFGAFRFTHRSRASEESGRDLERFSADGRSSNDERSDGNSGFELGPMRRVLNGSNAKKNVKATPKVKVTPSPDEHQSKWWASGNHTRDLLGSSASGSRSDSASGHREESGQSSSSVGLGIVALPPAALLSPSRPRAVSMPTAHRSLVGRKHLDTGDPHQFNERPSQAGHDLDHGHVPGMPVGHAQDDDSHAKTGSYSSMRENTPTRSMPMRTGTRAHAIEGEATNTPNSTPNSGPGATSIGDTGGGDDEDARSEDTSVSPGHSPRSSTEWPRSRQPR